jgi:hypothetical protein
MSTPLNYYDLVETFTTPGCAVCHLVLRDVDRHLDSLLYEYVNDPDTHRAFRNARGLCNTHGWQLIGYMGASLGTTILYRATVVEVLKIIDRTPLDTITSSGLARLLGTNAESSSAALADSLEPTSQCPVCAFLVNVEGSYLNTFMQHISDTQLQKVFEASDGLCLPHFRQALRTTAELASIKFIVETQRAIWTRLKGELEEFQAKSGQDRRHEPMGSEGDSWRRAIGRMSGESGVFSLDRRTP